MVAKKRILLILLTTLTFILILIASWPADMKTAKTKTDPYKRLYTSATLKPDHLQLSIMYMYINGKELGFSHRCTSWQAATQGLGALGNAFTEEHLKPKVFRRCSSEWVFPMELKPWEFRPIDLEHVLLCIFTYNIEDQVTGEKSTRFVVAVQTNPSYP